MSFNLTAVLRLRDDFSNPARRISRSMTSMTSGVGKLTAGFTGLAAAIGGAVGIAKTLEKTVGEAMKYEMSAITIDAMFNSKDIGKQYRDMVEKIAIESPILESQEMLSSSRGFITKSKDFKDLEKMIKITEKLAAYDEIQGTKGAAFALNEMMSGDAISLQERFELSRSDLKPIKDLFKDGQLTKGLEEMDKYLEKIGITSKMISDAGNATGGKLAQVREQWAKMLREMGEPSLKVMAEFFDNLLTRLNGPDAQRFADIGASWIKKILNGLTTNAVKLYDWFAALTSSSEWAEKSTLFGKVTFIIENIYDKFLTWLKSENGQSQIKQMSSDLIEIAAGFLIASQDALVNAAMAVGKSVGSALVSAASAEFAQWQNRMMNESALFKLPALAPVKWANNIGTKLFGPKEEKGEARASGISFVRPQNVQATLHRGERVLTPEENRAYSQGGGGGVSITIQNMQVRKDSDIDAIGDALFRRINQARMAGA